MDILLLPHVLLPAIYVWNFKLNSIQEISLITFLYRGCY